MAAYLNESRIKNPFEAQGKLELRILRSLRQLSNSGFTMIEILIGIAIISVLSASIYTAVMSTDVRQKTGDANRMHDIDQIKNAIELYYQDHSCFPPASDANFSGALSGGLEWHDSTNTSVIYMKKIPKDPDKVTTYVYKTDTIACPQWMSLFSKLSKAPTRFTACPLPSYAKADATCIPAGATVPLNSTSSETWGCVTSGSVACAAPTPTPIIPGSPTSTPIATPTPAGRVAPCFPPCETIGYGDVDGNGVINNSDVTLVNSLFGPVNSPQKKRADVNNDLIVDDTDRTLIQNFVTNGGTFPVCPIPTPTPTPTPTATPIPTPMPGTQQSFTIALPASALPQLFTGNISSLNPTAGQSVALSVSTDGYENPNPITSITATVKTDTKTNVYNFSLTSGTVTNGAWGAIWIQNDTVNLNFLITVTATDSIGNTSTFAIALR